MFDIGKLVNINPSMISTKYLCPTTKIPFPEFGVNFTFIIKPWPHSAVSIFPEKPGFPIIPF